MTHCKIRWEMSFTTRSVCAVQSCHKFIISFFVAFISFIYSWPSLTLTMSRPPAEYHSHDFDVEEWAQSALKDCILPPIVEETVEPVPPHNESERWEEFFVAHSGGLFFKARNYLFPEFNKWLTNIPYVGAPAVVLEAGCGHGCSMFPLLESLPHIKSYIATDYSSVALQILQENKEYDPSRVRCITWDFTQMPTFELALAGLSVPQAILCIFALSAVDPKDHETTLRNFITLLPPGGVILFRDYGLYDMTMFRHDIRIGEALFRRPDGTIAYYFSLDDVKALACKVGFVARELEYATVKTENRKNGKIMHRVFVHAVLQKPIIETEKNDADAQQHCST